MRLFSKLASGDEAVLNNLNLSLKDFDAHYQKKYKIIAGTDEAGRGALAGPVVAAAVILKNNFDYGEINDSKQLEAKKREEFFHIIKENALAFSYAFVSAEEVDRLNPLWASLTAMSKALLSLNPAPNFVLVDGNKKPSVPYRCLAVVKGDGRSLSVAAASIVAKVVRDNFMQEEHLKYPAYGFNTHKGYGTKKHLAALKELGALPIHRKTFKGVLPEKPKEEKKLF